jgi:hypothetical protein
MMVELKRRRENFLEGRAEPTNVISQETSWKKLWKAKVPSKLRIFAWRLARSTLLTGEVRARRHMATTASCPICGIAVDNWRHSLLDCNMARSVWSLKDEDDILPLFADEIDNPKLWLFTLSGILSLWLLWLLYGPFGGLDGSSSMKEFISHHCPRMLSYNDT